MSDDRAMKEFMGVEYDDGRLTEKEFFKQYPNCVSVALWGARFVSSALTSDEYIRFDHATGTYKSCPR